MNELVSVIIPTYNRPNTLERAIRSVVNQTYKNIEIIVVDDNANNLPIRKEVEKIVSKYDNVSLIKNRKNLGGSKSRNAGLKKANGKFVAFLDDDDEFLSTKIEKQYNLYQEKKNHKIGMIYCYSNFVSPSTTKTKKTNYEGIPLKEHLILCLAATSWWFCPKEALEAVGGFADYSSHQDAITLFNLLCNGYEVYCVPEILLNYTVPDGKGITKVSEKWINVDKEYMGMYEKIKDRFSKQDQKEIEYSFYDRLASMYYILRNKKELKFYTKKCLRMYPFRKTTIKSVIKYIICSIGL